MVSVGVEALERDGDVELRRLIVNQKTVYLFYHLYILNILQYHIIKDAEDMFNANISSNENFEYYPE